MVKAPHVLWTVWTDAGRKDEPFGYYPIAKDLPTEDAAKMVETLEVNGWSASRQPQNPPDDQH